MSQTQLVHVIMSRNGCQELFSFLFILRRRRDLNPRTAQTVYTLSRGTSSATWVLLHITNCSVSKIDYTKCFYICQHPFLFFSILFVGLQYMLINRHVIFNLLKAYRQSTNRFLMSYSFTFLIFYTDLPIFLRYSHRTKSLFWQTLVPFAVARDYFYSAEACILAEYLLSNRKLWFLIR